MVIRYPDGGVEFHFFRPEAGRVYLAGDFNAWDCTATPMSRRPDGYWLRYLRLTQGIHSFKYFADGEWFPDYAAFGVEPGSSGLNSIVVVG